MHTPILPQDLHIHTTFSTGDDSVVPEQTVGLVAGVGHARVVGISDHLDHVHGPAFAAYRDTVRRHELYLGVEVDGSAWIETALAHAGDLDYLLYHCRNHTSEYRGAERLLDSGLPVIVSHPLAFGADIARVPPECLLEVNNRYVWRSDWRCGFGPWVGRRRFVIGSDAHQPHWLGQHIARHVADVLGITETVLLTPPSATAHHDGP